MWRRTSLILSAISIALSLVALALIWLSVTSDDTTLGSIGTSTAYMCDCSTGASL